MDFYQEQHRFTLSQHANVESDSDEESSWVMLNQEGEIVKLPNEKIFYKVRSRISLDVSTPRSVADATGFSLKSDSGLVYITNHRVSEDGLNDVLPRRSPLEPRRGLF